MRGTSRAILLRNRFPLPTCPWFVALPVVVSFLFTALDAARAPAFFGCCSAPQTLRQDFGGNDAAVFCRLIAEPGPGDGDRALFEVTEILKDTELLPKPRSSASVPHRFRTTMKTDGVGAEFLVFASLNEAGTALAWGEAEPVNNREMAYVRSVATLPSYEVEAEASTPPSRLKRLLPFLDAFDPLIVYDLNYELATIPYAEIRAARREIPAGLLRQWIADPTTSEARLRYYVLLLSACGTKADLPLVRSLLEKYDESHDPAITCLILLGGEQELAAVETKYFKPQKKLREFEIGEIVDRPGAMRALALASQHSETIERDRFVESFRLALDFPEVVGEAANELARLEDWDSTPQLMEFFRANVKHSDRDWDRLSIVNYIRRSPRADADQHLAELRELDPESVMDSEKTYPIRVERMALVIARGF